MADQRVCDNCGAQLGAFERTYSWHVGDSTTQVCSKCYKKLAESRPRLSDVCKALCAVLIFAGVAVLAYFLMCYLINCAYSWLR